MGGERAPRVWRGQTHDARSQARRAQLIQAGVELLGTGGTAGVTMRAACRDAGLSLRYFYESFADTDELILAVYDQCNAELLARMAGVAGKAAPITVALDRAAAYFEEDPRRLRILLREPQSSSLLADHRAEVLPGLLGSLVGPPGNGDSPPVTAARAMSASALAGALTALILDWADGRLHVSRAELVAFAAGLVRAELSGVSPSQS
ncbi:TetR/AcrR family transcriptional regulator [Mycolicibacter heraklionensis]|uniref:TetR/AcrR family transcriptional regulator n=1 Tax=Mycolicibacter heraklionensis TaxID=512402 RepID=A0A9X7ZI04_9MYCO|nr:TetR/AcrR family transcriptional regulator [Mycolicibacter heraklionensis]QZA08148.1 TetR/AcrR family transcriptional regulator [Mycolicibacter heraklionensis]